MGIEQISISPLLFFRVLRVTGQWLHLSHRKVPISFSSSFVQVLLDLALIREGIERPTSSVCDPVHTCVHVGWICRSV